MHALIKILRGVTESIPLSNRQGSILVVGGERFTIVDETGKWLVTPGRWAVRDGVDLILYFSDGTEVRLVGFYTATNVAIQLPSMEGIIEITEEVSEGATLTDGRELLFADGAKHLLIQNAPEQVAVGVYNSFEDAVLTYFPEDEFGAYIVSEAAPRAVVEVGTEDPGAFFGFAALTVMFDRDDEENAPAQAAPEFVSPDAVSVLENDGLVIYQAEVNSPDAVTFSLKPGVGDAAILSVDAETGAVSVLNPTDFESKESYTFTLIATDSQGQATERVVTVAIEDAVEVAPIVAVVPTTLAALDSPSQGETNDVDFLVTRTGAEQAAVFAWTLAGDVAADYAEGAPSGTVEFLAGETEQTVTVGIPSSASNQTSRTATLQIGTIEQGYLVDAENASAEVTLLDTAAVESSSVEFTISTENRGQIREGSLDDQTKAVTYTVRRSGDVTDALMIEYRLVPSGQALLDVDDFVAGVDALGDNFGLPSGQVSFAAGSDSAEFTFSITSDNEVGADEAFRVVLGGANFPSEAIVTGNSGGVILNDDAYVTVVAEARVDVQSGELTHDFSVVRSGLLTGEHRVNYRLVASDGGSDEALQALIDTPTTGTLVFADGESEKSFDIALKEALQVAGEIPIALELTAADDSNVNLVASRAVTRLLPNLQEIEVLDQNPDLVFEGSEPTDASTFSYVVTRSGLIDQDAIIDWRVEGGNGLAVSANDFAGGELPSGTLTFAPNETSKLIEFITAPDQLIDGNENFRLILSSDSQGVRILNDQVTGFIADDESAVGLNQTAGVFSATEGDVDGQALRVTVSRVGFTNSESTVAWRVTPGSADLSDLVSGQDSLGDNQGYPSGRVTFAPGESSATALIRLAGDSVLESDETLLVTLSEPSSGTKLIGIDGDVPGYGVDATVVIRNDDSVLSLEQRSTSGLEGNGPGSFIPVVVTRTGSTEGTDWVKWSVAGAPGASVDVQDIDTSNSAINSDIKADSSWIDLLSVTGSEQVSARLEIPTSGYLLIEHQQTPFAGNELSVDTNTLLVNAIRVNGGTLGVLGADKTTLLNGLTPDSDGAFLTADNAQTIVTDFSLGGRQVILSADESFDRQLFRIQGKDAAGNVIEEVLRGSDSTVLTSEQYYAEVTSISRVAPSISFGAFDSEQGYFSSSDTLGDFYQGGTLQSGTLTFAEHSRDLSVNNGFVGSTGDWLYDRSLFPQLGSTPSHLTMSSNADLQGLTFEVTGAIHLASFQRDLSIVETNDRSYSLALESSDNQLVQFEAPSAIRFEQLAPVAQGRDGSADPSYFKVYGYGDDGGLISELVEVPEAFLDSVAVVSAGSQGELLSSEVSIETPGRILFSQEPANLVVTVAMLEEALGQSITDGSSVYLGSDDGALYYDANNDGTFTRLTSSRTVPIDEIAAGRVQIESFGSRFYMEVNGSRVPPLAGEWDPLYITLKGFDPEGEAIEETVQIFGNFEQTVSSAQVFSSVTEMVASRDFDRTLLVGSSVPVDTTNLFVSVSDIIPTDSSGEPGSDLYMSNTGRVEAYVPVQFELTAGENSSILTSLAPEHKINTLFHVAVKEPLPEVTNITVSISDAQRYAAEVLTVQDVTGQATVDLDLYDTLTLVNFDGTLQVNEGSDAAPAWQAVEDATIEVADLVAGKIRLISGETGGVRLSDAALDLNGLAETIDALPAGYALDYDDLRSDYISDGGDDIYDDGNYLYIDDVEQSIWNQDNQQAPTTAAFGDYVYLTGANGALLAVTDWQGANEFLIDGETGADGNGERLTKKLDSSGPVKVYIDTIYDSGDPSINKILITDASNPSILSSTNTDDDRFGLSGLADASYVYYLVTYLNEDYIARGGDTPGGDPEDFIEKYALDLVQQIFPVEAISPVSTALFQGNNASVSVSVPRLAVSLPRTQSNLDQASNSELSGHVGGNTESSNSNYSIIQINASSVATTVDLDLELLGRAGLDVSQIKFAPSGSFSNSVSDAQTDGDNLLIPVFETDAIQTFLAPGMLVGVSVGSTPTAVSLSVSEGTVEVQNDDGIWQDLATWQAVNSETLPFGLFVAERVRFSGESVVGSGEVVYSDQSTDNITVNQQLSESGVSVGRVEQVGSINIANDGYLWIRHQNQSDFADGLDQLAIRELSVDGGGSISVVGTLSVSDGVAMATQLDESASNLSINGVSSRFVLPESVDPSQLVVYFEPQTFNYGSGSVTVTGVDTNGAPVSITQSYDDSNDQNRPPQGNTVLLDFSGHDLASIQDIIFTGSNAEVYLPSRYGVTSGDLNGLGVRINVPLQAASDDFYVSEYFDVYDRVAGLELSAGDQDRYVQNRGFDDSALTIASNPSLDGDQRLVFTSSVPLDGRAIVISGVDENGQAASETLTFAGDQRVVWTETVYQSVTSAVLDAGSGEGLISMGSSTVFSEPNAVAFYGRDLGDQGFSGAVFGLDADGNPLTVQGSGQAEYAIDELGVFSEIFAVTFGNEEGRADVYYKPADASGDLPPWGEIPLDAGLLNDEGQLVFEAPQHIVVLPLNAGLQRSVRISGLDVDGQPLVEVIQTANYNNNHINDSVYSTPTYMVTEQPFSVVESIEYSTWHSNTNAVSDGQYFDIGFLAAGGFESSVGQAGGGLAFGESIAEFDRPVQITLSSSDNLSDREFTIEGFDQDGNPQTEVLTGPSANTVTTVGFFSQVTQVSASEGTAGEIEVGYLDVGALNNGFELAGIGTEENPLVGTTTNGIAGSESSVLLHIKTNGAESVTLSYDLLFEGSPGQDTAYLEFSPVIPAIDGFASLYQGVTVFEDGASTAQILVPTSGDPDFEGDELSRLQIVSGSLGTTIDATDNLTDVEFIDDDFVVQFDTDALRGQEGGLTNGRIAFDLVRTGSLVAGSVGFSVTGLSDSTEGAASTADFAALTGAVQFAEGQVRATGFVEVKGDYAVEQPEQFTLQLDPSTAASGYTIDGASTLVGTIENDDVSVTLSSTANSVLEGDSGVATHSLIVSRQGDLTQRTELVWTVQPLSTNDTIAALATDFAGGVFPTGTLVFEPNTDSVPFDLYTLDIESLGDVLSGADRSFSVTLSNPVGGTTEIVTASVVQTIQEDDPLALTLTAIDATEGTADPALGQTLTYEVERSGNTDSALTLVWSLRSVEGVDDIEVGDFIGTAFPSGTLSFLAGEATTQLSFDVVDDGLPELDERFVIEFTNPAAALDGLEGTVTGTVVDDDNGYAIELVGGPSLTESNDSQTVEIRFIRSDTELEETLPWALVGIDGVASNFSGDTSGSVTFDAGSAIATASIVLTGDSVRENDVPFTIRLDTSATAVAAVTDQAVTLEDDDSEFGVMLVTEGGVTVEGSALTTDGISLTFTVTREGNLSEPATVDYRLSSEAGVSPSDLITSVDALGDNGGLPSGTLTFEPDVATATVVIEVLKDSIVEGDERFELVLDNPSVGSSLKSGQESVGQVLADDDVEVRVAEVSKGQVISEDAGAESAGVYGTDAETVSVTYTLERVTGNTDLISKVAWSLESNDMDLRQYSATSLIQGDFVGATSGEVLFGAGETEKQITVQVRKDRIGEISNVFDVVLESRSAGTSIAEGNIRTETQVIDSDVSIRFGASDLVKSEGRNGTTPATIELIREGDLSGASVLNWSVSLGTDDFVETSGQVEFAAGESSKLIELQIIGDNVVERDEDFSLTVSAVSGVDSVEGRVLSSTRGGKIESDEGTFAVKDPDSSQIDEGDIGSRSLVFEITRDVTADAASVEWAVQTRLPSNKTVIDEFYGISGATIRPLLAVDADDFLSTDQLGTNFGLPSGTVVFAEGEESKQIEILIAGDFGPEDTELFQVVLSNPSEGYSVQDPREFTLVNDDTLFSIGEPDLSSPASLSEPVLEGETVTFTVHRSGSFDGDALVDWQVDFDPSLISEASGRYLGSADDFVDTLSGTLFFAAGETSKEVSLEIADDAVAEDVIEAFNFSLENARWDDASLTDGIGISQVQNRVESFIVDNDTGSTVAISASISNQGLEGHPGDAAPTVITAVLTRSGDTTGAQQVAVEISEVFPIGSFAGAIGTPETAYRYNSQLGPQPISQVGLVQFAAGETEKEFTITVPGDYLVESDQVVHMNLYTMADIAERVLDPSYAYADLDLLRTASNSRLTQLILGVDENGNQGVDVLDGDADHLPNSGSLRVDSESGETSVQIVNDDIAFGLTGHLTSTGQSALNFYEGDAGTTALSLQIQRSGVMDTDEVVSYTLTAGTAEAGTDVIVGSGTLEFLAGESSKTLSLASVVGDTIVEANETFTISFSHPDAHVSVPGTQTITILNDDVLWSVSAPVQTLSEGTASDTQFSVTVSRGAGYAGAATVDYALQPTGSHGIDASDIVEGLTGRIQFAAGEMSKTVLLNVSADDLAEYDETFDFALTDASFGQIDPTDGQIGFTLINDDSSIRIGDASVTETDDGTQVVTFDVTRFGTQAEVATVNWSVIHGTADGGDIDNSQSGVVTFNTVDGSLTSGTETQTISINVLGDRAIEPDETFIVRLSSPSGATLSDAEGTGTIVDNDTVYQITAGATAEEGEAQTFTVTRLGDASGAATVDWSVEATTGSHASDVLDFPGGVFPSGSVSFAAGETVKTFTVTSAEDTDAELANAYRVTLTAVDGNGSHPSITPSNGAVISTFGVIENDDVGSVTVDTIDAYLTGADAPAVVEGDDGSVEAVFALTLSAPLEYAATLNYTVIAGSASSTDAADFGGTLPTGTLTLQAGRTSFEIRIPVSGDSLAESSEEFRLQLDNLSPWVAFGSAGSTEPTLILNGSVTNDDSEVSVDNQYTEVSPRLYTEGDSEADAAVVEFVVTRSGSDLSKTVTVDYAVTALSAFASEVEFADGLPSGTLTFAAGETEKTVQMQVQGDLLPELQDVFKLTLSNPSAGLSIGHGESVVAIVDDDKDVYAVSVASASQQEGDSGLTEFVFTVTRQSSEASATLDWSATETTVNGLNPLLFATASGQISFAVGEASAEVRVSVQGDTLGDVDKSFDFDLSNLQVVGFAVPAEIGTAKVSVTVENDDAAYGLQSVTPLDDREGSDSDGQVVEFSIVRDGDLSQGASLDWQVVLDGVNPADMTDFGGFIPSGSVTFAADEAEKTLRFTLLGDNRYESDETYGIEISNLQSSDLDARITTSRLNKSILNDDNGVSVSAQNATLTEGDSGQQSTSFVIDVDGLAGEWVTVDYVIEGSGLNPVGASDLATGQFGAGQLSVKIGDDGTASTSVSVDVLGDRLYESDETLRFRVTGVENGVAVVSSATTSIIDTDSVASVAVTDGFSATPVEGDSDTTAVSFSVTRQGDLSRVARVDYEVVGFGDNPLTASDLLGGALPTGSLLFAADEAEKTITFEVQGDLDFESDESFVVRLLPSADNGDDVAEMALSDEARQLIGTILNDDVSAITISSVVSSVNEGSGEVGNKLAFELSRDGDNRAPLTVTYDLINDGVNDLPESAVVGGLTNRSVTFEAGESRVLILIETVADTTPNSDYDFTVEVNAVDAGFAENPAAVQALIVDDDSGIFISSVASTVTEGETLTVTVLRRGANLAATDVTWTAQGIGKNPLSAQDVAALGLSGTVSFAEGQESASIEIDLVDDTLVEARETVRIELMASSDATQRIRESSVDVIVADNDLPTAGADEIRFGGTSDVIDALGGDDMIYAGGGADLIYGRDGNDHIETQGGADVVYAGAGDDMLYVAVGTLTELHAGRGYLDGGLGVDRLAIDGADQTIDLTSLVALGVLRNIERVDLYGNDLSLSVEALLNQDSDHVDTGSAVSQRQLLVAGQAGDQLEITDLSDWQERPERLTVDSGSYRVLSHATLEIELIVHSEVSIV